jgi:hydroxyacylglutathione hydrolase
VYWFHADNIVFAADTLFSVGCGRVIEGTMDQMWASMLKMRDLPDETKIFCGHEYTLANIKFALSVDKDNPALQARAVEAEKQIAAGEPTIPTTIGEEKKTNPFLRAGEPSLAAALDMAGKPANEVFAEIRERKNRF